MKSRIIVSLVAISIIPIFSIACTGCPEKPKPIFSKMVESEGIESYRVPAFLIRWALKFSDESEQFESLFQGSRFVSFAECDRSDKDNSLLFNKLCAQLEVSSYVSLIDIKEKDSNLTIKALIDDRNRIKEIVILVIDESSLVAFSMTGNMNANEIAKGISRINASSIAKK